MANPQKEDGYTAIANEIVEAIYKYPLSGHEFRMLLLIIRKTYGFQKIEDAVSLSQMMKALDLSKTRCSQVINKLQLQKIVTVTENINGIGKKYRFNKNFDQWATVHTRVNRYTKVKSTVTVLSNLPLHKSVSTKETITKETITKEKEVFVLPEKIKKETWDAYLEMRNVIKKPATEHAKKLIVKKLLSMTDEPNLVLEQSISNSYQGVFPLKIGGNNANKYGSNTNFRSFGTNRDLSPETTDEVERIARDYYAKHASTDGNT